MSGRHYAVATVIGNDCWFACENGQVSTDLSEAYLPTARAEADRFKSEMNLKEPFRGVLMFGLMATIGELTVGEVPENRTAIVMANGVKVHEEFGSGAFDQCELWALGMMAHGGQED